MRIIAGEFRSRRLKTVMGLDVRPTPDRLRESLFNVLAPRIQGTTFLDAYAGSGAVGIEAVSRGAARAVLIERNPVALRTIRENVADLGISDRVSILCGRATNFLATQPATFVFLDPPYEQEKEYAEAFALLAVTHSVQVIAQHSVRLKLPESYGRLARVREIRQGENILSFYGRASIT